jgi:RNA polymerase sigma factor (sigma-70 family)
VLAIVQDTAEAEDVSQEVFVEVYESVGSFRGTAVISTWLYRIATQKALEQLRRRKAQKRFAFLTSLFGNENEVVHHPPNFVHPGVLLEQQERAGVLFGHINRLPDNQKVAFTLCHVESLSHREIAEVMGVSVGAVESLLHRAKQQLRKSLATYYVSHLRFED